jgi:hypothetical protein
MIRDEINPSDTSKKDKLSAFEKEEHLIRIGRLPFYGTWVDFFSSQLKISADSTFEYSWGYDGTGSWTTGKWTREKDTLYFRSVPVYDVYHFVTNNEIKDSTALARFPESRLITALPDSDEIRLTQQNAHPMPDKLCFYKNKLLLFDPQGNLMTGKIPSPYMGKKNPMFRTWYFRDRGLDRYYVDSAYYDRIITRRLKIGVGISVMLQPVTSYHVDGSVGVVFSPQYYFNRKNRSGLSLGMPFSLGVTPLADSMSTEPSAGIAMDLPLVLNYNFESGSQKKGGSRFGYFAGGGIAYHYNIYTAAEKHQGITQQANGFGPVINAGIRLSLRRHRVDNMELRFSYMKIMAASRSDVLGISYLINFIGGWRRK